MKRDVEEGKRGFEGLETSGGYARWAGTNSPLSQVYGVGHLESRVNLEEIERFFGPRSDNWELITTPFANVEALREISAFGYMPDHFECVMLTEGRAPTERDDGPIVIREVDPSEADLAARIMESGFLDLPDVPAELTDSGKVMATNPFVRRFVAEWDGEPAATADLIDCGGMYLFAGAATRTAFRGRGIQKALSRRRLQEVGAGNLVQVVTLHGTASNRNARRLGFEPIYSKLVWMRR